MNASNVTGFDEFDDDGNDRRERDNIEQTLDILSYSNSETSSSFNVKDGRSSSVVDESTRARLHAPSIKKQDIDESSDSENELDGAKVAKRTPHEAPLPFPQKVSSRILFSIFKYLKKMLNEFAVFKTLKI